MILDVVGTKDPLPLMAHMVDKVGTKDPPGGTQSRFELPPCCHDML